MPSNSPGGGRMVGVILSLLALGGGVAPIETALGAPQAVYRWTDESGVTVYSRRPPPGTDAQQLTPEPGPSADEIERAEARMRSLLEPESSRQEATKGREGESPQEAERQAARRTNCEVARKNLASLGNPQIGQVRTPQGEVQDLTDELRARYLDEARGIIQENCD